MTSGFVKSKRRKLSATVTLELLHIFSTYSKFSGLGIPIDTLHSMISLALYLQIKFIHTSIRAHPTHTPIYFNVTNSSALVG